MLCFEENVIFKTATVDSESAAAGTTASISEDGKTITVTTHKLKSIDETVTLDYTIENKSQYNAELGALTCTSEDSDWSTYIALTEKNALNGTTVAKSTTSSADQVEIKMIRSYAGTAESNDKSFTFECTLPATARES